MEALRLLECAAQRLCRLRRVAGLGERELELAPENRERRAQLMAGVVDERALARERRLDALQHVVERSAQLSDLVTSWREWQSPAGLAQRDPFRLRGHASHRAKGGKRQRPATGRQDPDERGAGQREQQTEAVLRSTRGLS